MAEREFAVLLVLRSGEPGLSETAIHGLAGASAGYVQEFRNRLLASLPQSVERVVAVMAVEEAEALMAAREEAMEAIGLGAMTHRPGPDYVAPPDRKRRR